MTSTGLALIIIPTVTTAGLVAWLTMVFSADGHPGQVNRNSVGTHASIPGTTAKRLPVAAASANRPIEAAASGTPARQSRTAA